MDNSLSSPGGFDHVGGFGYSIGVSIGILFLITTITLASYYCARNQRPLTIPPHQIEHHHLQNQDYVVVEMGIDEETIKSYPKYLYSEAKKIEVEDSNTNIITCSICLGDYKNSDVLRELPDCGHIFHAKCIDTWLRMHPTCPLCRTSPLPTPLSTPLAEVVPLAIR
ncbi:hypothetical protein Leryth_000988 [Lithospermum erythrorhizon]|uniref:RING-type E3 ubiquitin transferase n=1 Tax=Lithospermum erythrorhizon TaxID=34254 RepID=A0AAV3NTG9_LITER|nr:hypothetical protein Leryth_000988 [Lithospermum erythrorhizon]